ERHRELASAQEPDIDDRIVVRELPGDEEYESAGGNRGECDDIGRMEPVFDLAAIEHDFQTAERDRDQHKPLPIDPEPAGQALAALALEHIRFDHQPLHQDERYDADRDV